MVRKNLAQPKPAARAKARPKLPAPTAEWCVGPTAMTAERMKGVLGWVEEGEEEKWGSDYLLVDELGKKVRCTKNARNRPFTEATARRYARDLLAGYWELNHETFVVGAEGNVLSGQHRGVGLVLAHQLWLADPAKYPYWKDAPTMDLLLTTGCSEEPRVTRTMDSGRPRTLSDVLYSLGLFSAKLTQKARVQLTRIADYAVRHLRHRTLRDEDAFSPRASHSESMEFINRHPKVKDAVLHIHAEEHDGSISRLVSLGKAAGLLYLMGCSASSFEAYHSQDPRTEKPLDWSLWDRACEFWASVSGNSTLLGPAWEELRRLDGLQPGRGSLTAGQWASVVSEAQTVVLLKAWGAYAGGPRRVLTAEDVRLEFSEPDEFGTRSLINLPVLAGIDLGDADREPAEPPAETLAMETPEDDETAEGDEEEVAEAAANARVDDAGEDGGGPGPDDPTPAEIAERAQAAIRRREEAESRAPKRRPQPIR